MEKRKGWTRFVNTPESIGLFNWNANMLDVIQGLDQICIFALYNEEKMRKKMESFSGCSDSSNPYETSIQKSFRTILWNWKKETRGLRELIHLMQFREANSLIRVCFIAFVPLKIPNQVVPLRNPHTLWKFVLYENNHHLIFLRMKVVASCSHTLTLKDNIMLIQISFSWKFENEVGMKLFSNPASGI